MKGTILGFPCLRLNGEFLATADHRTGDLIVKLPVERVLELIDRAAVEAFAPAGRKFKEWILVSDRDTRRWRKLLKDARAFTQSKHANNCY